MAKGFFVITPSESSAPVRRRQERLGWDKKNFMRLFSKYKLISNKAFSIDFASNPLVSPL
jgi:hypothetical protein